MSAGLTVEMVIAEAAAAYEVTRWNGLTSPGSTTALDLYAGGRAWWQRGDVQINALGTLNIFDLTFSKFGVLSAEKKKERELVRSISRGSLYKFDMTMHGPIFGLTARF